MKMKYGKTEVEISVEGAKSVTTLYENEMPKIENIKEAFEKAITEDVIGTKPLNELIEADDKITIILSDITRAWMHQEVICELLVRYLYETIQVPFENIKVVFALGTHRKHTKEEQRTLASPYVFDHVEEVVDHDCDAEDLVDIGTTSYGTQVLVNKRAIGRKVIAIGGTVHHIMAGYGGGRKSIVPGIAGRETIRHNHSMALDKELPKTDEKVGSGKFTNNPINEDMREAGKLLQPTFGINIVVNSESKHSGLFCGDFDEAWKESCRFVQKSYGVPIPYEADVVFVSCGGFPKDLNFYQSTKSLFNASRAVKKGGTIVFLAECSEGAGSKDFFDWLQPLREGHLDESLRKAFTIGGYIFYAACEAINKAGEVLLLAGDQLDADVVGDMNVKKYSTIEEIMEKVDVKDKDVYVMPFGGSLMPQLESDYKKISSDI